MCRFHLPLDNFSVSGFFAAANLYNNSDDVFNDFIIYESDGKGADDFIGFSGIYFDFRSFGIYDIRNGKIEENSSNYRNGVAMSLH